MSLAMSGIPWRMARALEAIRGVTHPAVPISFCAPCAGDDGRISAPTRMTSPSLGTLVVRWNFPGEAPLCFWLDVPGLASPGGEPVATRRLPLWMMPAAAEAFIALTRMADRNLATALIVTLNALVAKARREEDTHEQG